MDPDLTVPKKIRYSLIVIALDGAPGDKQLQTSINVDIAIIDINNKPPIIKDPGTVSVVENSPVSIKFFFHSLREGLLWQETTQWSAKSGKRYSSTLIILSFSVISECT